MVALRIFLSDSQVTTVTLHLQDDGSSVNVHINLQATTQVSGFANLIQTIQTVMSLFFFGGGGGWVSRWALNGSLFYTWR